MLLAFCQWLEQNSIIAAMGQSVSLAVVCEVLHYFTLFVLVGGAAIIDLRLLNIGFRSQSLTKLGLRTFPWIWLAFALNFLSGFFLSRARQCSITTTFHSVSQCWSSFSQSS